MRSSRSWALRSTEQPRLHLWESQGTTRRPGRLPGVTRASQLSRGLDTVATDPEACAAGPLPLQHPPHL